MSNTNVISGINALNEQNASIAKSEAHNLVSMILGQQEDNRVRLTRIEGYRKSLADLGKDVFTVERILGGPAPASPNMNEATILKVVEDLNRKRQDTLKTEAFNLSNSIDRELDLIAKNDERIAELRDHLAKLEVKSVTTAEILGS